MCRESAGRRDADETPEAQGGFGSRMPKTKHVLLFVVGIALVLGGCGTYVPNIQENPWAPDANRLVEAIVESIHCEIIQAVIYVVSHDSMNPKILEPGRHTAWLYNNWGAQIQITLKTDEQSALSPSGSYSPNIFNLLGGANISSEATRTDILNFYYMVKTLCNTGKVCPHLLFLILKIILPDHCLSRVILSCGTGCQPLCWALEPSKYRSPYQRA